MSLSVRFTYCTSSGRLVHDMSLSCLYHLRLINSELYSRNRNTVLTLQGVGWNGNRRQPSDFDRDSLRRSRCTRKDSYRFRMSYLGLGKVTNFWKTMHKVYIFYLGRKTTVSYRWQRWDCNQKEGRHRGIQEYMIQWDSFDQKKRVEASQICMKPTQGPSKCDQIGSQESGKWQGHWGKSCLLGLEVVWTMQRMQKCGKSSCKIHLPTRTLYHVCRFERNDRSGKKRCTGGINECLGWKSLQIKTLAQRRCLGELKRARHRLP